jgi:hypothetical protein
LEEKLIKFSENSIEPQKEIMLGTGGSCLIILATQEAEIRRITV